MKTRKVVNLSNILSFFGAALLLVPTIITPAANAEKKYNQVCNKTNEPLNVANGYKEKSIWYTQGWFKIQSNSCVNMYTKTPGFSEAYLYAEASNNRKRWTGEHTLCIDIMGTKFKLSSANKCDSSDFQGGVVPAKFVKITYLSYQDICITPRGMFVCQKGE
jgi:uncharacterized membrane protein